MSSLVDHQIRTLCREMGLVEPFDPDLVQPASIDVRLGNVIKREGRVCGPVEGRQEWVTEYIKDGDSFELFPGAFILAHTKEYVRIPNNIEANFQLKSSRGREGINHLLAGYIDPGVLRGNYTRVAERQAASFCSFAPWNAYWTVALRQARRCSSPPI